LPIRPLVFIAGTILVIVVPLNIWSPAVGLIVGLVPTAVAVLKQTGRLR